MSTPKEKLNKGQALNAKKKKFFRILQSANNVDSSRYCATVGDRLREEFEAKVTAAFEAAKQSAPKAPDQQETKKDAKTQRRLKKQNAQKAIKCPDLIVGMESTLRLIDRKEVAMVWIDNSLAVNLVNIVHKLCIVNRVFCLNHDLSLLKTLSKIKTMSMVSFKSNVQQTESPLHDLYNFLVTSVFRATQSEAIKGSDIEPVINDKDDKHESDKEQPQPQQKPTTLQTPNINFYLSNNVDQYSQTMRSRLKFTKDIVKDDISKQASFICLSKPSKDEYFPKYDFKAANEKRMQVKITFNEKESKVQSANSANKLAEVLFDLDKLNSSIDSSTNRTTFKSPKLVRGEIVPKQLLSAAKRKRANNKGIKQPDKKVKK